MQQQINQYILRSLKSMAENATEHTESYGHLWNCSGLKV